MLTVPSKNQAVKAQIAEAQKVASGSGSEQDIAEAKIELEVRCPFPRLLTLAVPQFQYLDVPRSKLTKQNRCWRLCRLL